MIRREVRRARKMYRCDGAVSAYCRSIIPGDRYLLHVASPNHDDYGNDHWWTLRACRACAEVYGTTWDEPEAVDERPPMRDRLRCNLCRRWTRQWVVQGLDRSADPDATSRRICDRCATQMRRTE